MRTRAGLAAAREDGRIGGRRPRLTAEDWAQAGRLIAAGESRKRVAIIYDTGCQRYTKNFLRGVEKTPPSRRMQEWAVANWRTFDSASIE